jgi:hypothetical protein
MNQPRSNQVLMLKALLTIFLLTICFLLLWGWQSGITNLAGFIISAVVLAGATVGAGALVGRWFVSLLISRKVEVEG